MKKKITVLTLSAMLLALSVPAQAQQAKALRELNVAYPLGGSTSYFWVAHRSGAFEKYGLKLKPIYIRGGVAAVQ